MGVMINQFSFVRNRLVIGVIAAALGIGTTLLVQRVKAAGVPAKGALTYSGFLTQSDGTPINGSKPVALFGYTAQTATDPVCQVLSTPVTFTAGWFKILLPETCVAAVHASTELWIDVQVEGMSVGRTRVGAVPYSLEAASAVQATTAASATVAANATLFAGNAPSAFQRPLKNSCASGMTSLAADGTASCSAFAVFKKTQWGNDGTVSCNVFCAGAQWGGASATGTCVAARKTDTKEWVDCTTTNYVDGAKNGLECWCSRPTD